MKKYLLPLFRMLIIFSLFVGSLALLQDILIFPGLVPPLMNGKERDLSKIQPDIAPLWLTTSDGAKLDVRYLEATPSSAGKKYTAIIFNGNAGSLSGIYWYQQWFKKQGISSYAFDYRGFGSSTGWPSEEKMYADAEALWDFVQQRDDLLDRQIIIMGISIGTGPASYLASLKKAENLILLSPYISIPEVVRGRPTDKFFAPFLRYEFNNSERIQEMDQTYVILTHGMRDTVIPFEHSEKLNSLYSGQAGIDFIRSEEADHNNLMNHVRDKLSAALQKRLREESSAEEIAPKRTEN